MIKIVMCADDTDDVTKKTSTGKIVEIMAKKAESLGGIIRLGVTRHQLLLDKEIAYTSHNSSMCFEADVPEFVLEKIWEESCKVLNEEMAETSDPGLCMCRLDRVADIDQLISFGIRAQKEVLTKEQAYGLAKDINVRLEEFGGTGLGVIGAIAGVGLRLSGNDGTFRGKGRKDVRLKLMPVREIKSKLNIHKIITKDGEVLSDDTAVFIGNQVKLIYSDYHVIAAAKKSINDTWEICDREDMVDNMIDRKSWNTCCEHFRTDNDLEECLNNRKACYNCLYRKWTKEGILCILRDK
jgi:hypothetical protein